jgi:hypothetical protein
VGFRQPELGTKSPIRRYVGFDFESFRGVNLEADPGAISPEELQAGINIRILPSGQLVGREGQEKAYADALAGCVTLIFDDEEPSAAASAPLYYNSESEDGVFLMKRIDAFEATPATIGPSPGTISGQQFVDFDDELFTFQDNALYSVDIDSGDATLRLTLPEVPAIHSAIAFDDGTGEKLWMATSVGKIFSWDGTTVVEDEDFMSQGMLLVYAENLFCCAIGVLYQRNGVTWDAIDTSAMGFIDFEPSDWVVHQSYLYLCGYVTDNGDLGTAPAIYRYDTVTLSLARNLWSPSSGEIGAPEGCRALTVLEDVLYYLWFECEFQQHYVGRYDGVWDDTHKNLTAQWEGIPTNLQMAHECLYVGGFNPAAIDSPNLVRSPGTDIAGTWVVVDTGFGSAGSDMILFGEA